MDVKNSLNSLDKLSGFVGVFMQTSNKQGLFLLLFFLEYVKLQIPCHKIFQRIFKELQIVGLFANS